MDLSGISTLTASSFYFASSTFEPDSCESSATWQNKGTHSQLQLLISVSSLSSWQLGLLWLLRHQCWRWLQQTVAADAPLVLALRVKDDAGSTWIISTKLCQIVPAVSLLFQCVYTTLNVRTFAHSGWMMPRDLCGFISKHSHCRGGLDDTSVFCAGVIAALAWCVLCGCRPFSW